MSHVLIELESRWRKMFSSLLEGSDLPPSELLRTEGLMEAVVLAGELTSDLVRERMALVYEEVHGKSLAEVFGSDWGEFYPFPQIPFAQQRAPVYPSTSD
ncbi:MAG: hypothetical protein ACI9DH_000649 [Halioglobus sp.]|jgi:hypothetical protein